MICPQSNPIMKNTKELERVEIIAVVDTLRVCLVSDVIKEWGMYSLICVHEYYFILCNSCLDGNIYIPSLRTMADNNYQ